MYIYIYIYIYISEVGLRWVDGGRTFAGVSSGFLPELYTRTHKQNKANKQAKQQTNKKDREKTNHTPRGNHNSISNNEFRRNFTEFAESHRNRRLLRGGWAPTRRRPDFHRSFIGIFAGTLQSSQHLTGIDVCYGGDGRLLDGGRACRSHSLTTCRLSTSLSLYLYLSLYIYMYIYIIYIYILLLLLLLVFFIIIIINNMIIQLLIPLVSSWPASRKLGER